MGYLYLVLALIVQSSLTFAQTEENEDVVGHWEELMTPPDFEVVKDYHDAKIDWMDMFMPPNVMHPTSSAAIMGAVMNGDECTEEDVDAIKQAAKQMTVALQAEMVNFLSSITPVNTEKQVDENGVRKKRSTERPMDSAQMVMRLLKHIKSSNDYQNIAIEKMMTAQEIADKYGIEFTPDADLFTDLAIAANEQTKQLSAILEEVSDIKNGTEEVKSVPLEEQNCEEIPVDNNTYYVYSVNHPHHENFQPMAQQNPFLPYEYAPEQLQGRPLPNHDHHHHAHFNNAQFETQIMPPPHHHTPSPPVSPNPNFYDSMMAYAPEPDFYPYCPMEPVTTTTTIYLPIPELLAPEPELVGEEYEETVSSKVTVDRDDEPGSATVNHVMTYTLSEKAHFKKPEIENLPQQMQYTFFLM